MEENNGAVIGEVEDVLDQAVTGQPHPLLRVRRRAQEGAGGEELWEEHLIPYVRSIVPWVDVQRGAVWVDPPSGLLDLGRRRLLVGRLKVALAPYVNATGSRGSRGVAGVGVMPSRSQLQAAGRGDLVHLVRQAGGFLEVAQALGLRAPRRPAGYWHDEANLDRELSLFVGAHWARFTTPGAQEEYWYNQVTHSIRWEPPQLPELISIDDEGGYLLAENEEDRVVPSRTAVMAAGRYDLHQAIVSLGGYREVARLLGRRPAWPPSQHLRTLRSLRAALREFAEECGGEKGVMPSASQLLEAGRGDIYQAVIRAGGFHPVAAKLQLRTRHRPVASWQDLDAVLGALREWLGLREGQEPSPRMRLPTHEELRAAGRHDLR